MKNFILPAFRLLFVMTILTGVIYPVTMTLLSLAIFPYQAKGSMIEKDGRVIGSDLIGQGFTSDRYFHSRPSGIGYNPAPSCGTNWGPTDKRMADSVKVRRERFILQNNLSEEKETPVEMLFASGSGVDPHISPDAALMQVDRIAAVRGFRMQEKSILRSLVEKHVEQAQFGIFGNPRVNVLKLNIALDALQGI